MVMVQESLFAAVAVATVATVAEAQGSDNGGISQTVQCVREADEAHTDGDGVGEDIGSRQEQEASGDGGDASRACTSPEPTAGDVMPPAYADPSDDAALEALGLPFETRGAGGERLCRHHPSRAIRSRGAPCAECWAAGRGVGGERSEGEEAANG